MSEFWMRRIQLLVAGRSVAFPPLRIDFRVDFDTDDDPNTAEIKLYNLSDDTISRLKKGLSLVLNAGYESDVGTIFAGDIAKVRTEWQGVDKITTIIAGDGLNAILNAKVSKTFKPGIRASQIIRDIIGAFGLEVGTIKLAKDVVYQKGKVVQGKLQQVIRQIAKDCQSGVTITNGVIMIRPKTAGTQTGFLLKHDTGLLGTPGYLDSEDADYQVESLLNHRITAGSLLKIQSRTANGTFRVVRGSHEANDAAFVTRMEVAAV